MRARTYKRIIDTTLYYVLAIIPFIYVGIIGIKNGYDGIANCISNLTGVFSGTGIYTAINGVIGENGVTPLLNAQTAFFSDYICYMVYITVIHLIIDCIQFIPALAHNFISTVGGKEFE